MIRLASIVPRWEIICQSTSIKLYPIWPLQWRPRSNIELGLHYSAQNRGEWEEWVPPYRGNPNSYLPVLLPLKTSSPVMT